MNEKARGREPHNPRLELMPKIERIEAIVNSG
jgi:hypothetical protein